MLKHNWATVLKTFPTKNVAGILPRSRPPPTENWPRRHIEVKGRAQGQTTITVSRNEIIYGLNQTNQFILAIVVVDGESHQGPYYLLNPFNQEPDFGVASINYDLEELLSRATLQNLPSW